MEVPVGVRDLDKDIESACPQRSLPALEGFFPSYIPSILLHCSFSPKKKDPLVRLTASGLIFASSPSSFHSFVLGISITPSIIACATCTPLGPNSLAKLCASALIANFPVAKLEHKALPFTEAVAPVKINVGGYSGAGEEEPEARRRGRAAREKKYAPVLRYNVE